MVDRCENCPHLEKGRFCPPELLGGCDLLIIGEGPGEQEVRLGRPFVGPSGRLLNSVLSRAGLRPNTKVSKTNATLCRVPLGGKVDSKMISCCRSRVEKEIEQEKPKLILALGNSAVESLTGKPAKITQIHGMPFHLGCLPVLPCLHPAAVLRAGSDLGKFQKAIDYAVSIVQGGGVKDPGSTKFKIAKAEELDDLVFGRLTERLPPGSVLGCDIETTGLNPRRDRIIALGIAWRLNRVLIFPGDLIHSESKAIQFLLTNSHWKYVWHNGKFDVSFLRQMGIPARVDHDTMLMHYALDEVKGTHDLEHLAGEYLGATDYKSDTEKAKKNGWRGADPQGLCEYLARDCDYTLQLYSRLGQELVRTEGLETLYTGVFLRASELLGSVERNGFYVDKAELQSLRDHLVPERDGAYRTLQDAVREVWSGTETFKRTGSSAPEVNPASPKQVTQLLYHDLGLKVPPGYARNTREDTLKVLPSNPVTEAILQYRKAAKSLGTYVDGIEDRIDSTTGRIHCTYLIHGTVTGRLSSRDPNLQNIPRDPRIRAVFQAPLGRKLLETDLDQAELRVLANLSKDPGLIEIYQSGRKLHHEVAIEMYGENYSADQYIRAKAINFGIMYGRGAESLVKEFGGPNIEPSARLTIPEAKRLVKAWFGRFPIAYQFVQKLRSAPQNGVALRSPSGRRRRFGLVTESNLNELQNEAANFPIQSTASDITLLSACDVNNYRGFEFSGAKIVNLVHDSIVFEVPDDEKIIQWIAHKTAEAFIANGKHLLGDAVPMLAEFKLGTKWGSLEKVKL